MSDTGKSVLSISEQIEQIKYEICENVCRWREYCLSIKKNPDEAQNYLIENYCENCPLGRL